MVRNDELINRDLIRRWLLWGFFWLMFAPTVGVLISTKFNYPDFLGEAAWSIIGLSRPGAARAGSRRCPRGARLGRPAAHRLTTPRQLFHLSGHSGALFDTRRVSFVLTVGFNSSYRFSRC